MRLANKARRTWFAVVRPTQGANSGSKNAIFGTLTNQSNFSGLVAHVSNTTPAYMLRFESGGDFFTNGSSNIGDSSWHILAGRLSAGTDSLRPAVAAAQVGGVDGRPSGSTTARR